MVTDIVLLERLTYDYVSDLFTPFPGDTYYIALIPSNGISGSVTLNVPVGYTGNLIPFEGINPNTSTGDLFPATPSHAHFYKLH